MDDVLDSLELIKKQVISSLYGISPDSSSKELTTQITQSNNLHISEKENKLSLESDSNVVSETAETDQASTLSGMVPTFYLTKTPAATSTATSNTTLGAQYNSNILVSSIDDYDLPQINSTHEEVAEMLTRSGDPLGILQYASQHQNNTLILTAEDVADLERDALRELAYKRRRPSQMGS